MWIAQHPCGTWCAYKFEPRQKMGGWDGVVHARLTIQNWLISWRETLRCIPEDEYLERYASKEVR